jgi:Zn-dependent protease with chaperone function
MKFQAKYFDGTRPLSRPVILELRKGEIAVIFENGEVINWPFSEIKQDDSQNTAIVFLNRSTHEKIELINGEENLPKHLLKRTSFRFNSKHLMACLGGIIFLMIFFWQSLPYFTRYVASKIPFEYEKALGDKLMKSFFRESKICRPSKNAEIAFNKLILLLDPANELDVKIMDSPDVNAFTLPGGNILIMSGLIKNLKSIDELVGVLAHEISHVRRRHVLQKIISTLSTALLIQLLAGDFTSVFAIDPSSFVALGTLTFDRRMEKEADQDALEGLIKLGINPESMVSFFKRQVSTPYTLQFLSTHPGDEERISLFRSKKIDFHSVSLFTSSEWESLKSYCEDDLSSNRIKTPFKKEARPEFRPKNFFKE